MNPEFMLPHQREQYRRHLQTVTDLQGRKAKEANNPHLDAAIAEARDNLDALSQAAKQNEKQFPTPELFQQYINQYNQNLQQRRAEISGSSNPTAPQLTTEKIRALQTKSQQFVARMKEISATLSKADLPDENKKQLELEYEHHKQQMEVLEKVFRTNQPPARIAAAAARNMPENTTAQSSTPPAPQVQPVTPTVRNIPPAPVAMQPAPSQPSLPPTLSMGPLPRPSVNNGVPPPRPTLTGGYPVGNPLLGTTTPSGAPNVFNLVKDGESRLLSKRKLQDLVKSIDPDERLEPDVEEVFTLNTMLIEVTDGGGG
jgi:transcription initiation factor TFIID subunit TAF12